MPGSSTNAFIATTCSRSLRSPSCRRNPAYSAICRLRFLWRRNRLRPSRCLLQLRSISIYPWAMTRFTSWRPSLPSLLLLLQSSRQPDQLDAKNARSSRRRQRLLPRRRVRSQSLHCPPRHRHRAAIRIPSQSGSAHELCPTSRRSLWSFCSFSCFSRGRAHTPAATRSSVKAFSA